MSGPKVLVLYKVSNAKSDVGLYNAFSMPRGNGITLALVKRHCPSLGKLNHAGVEGYHWRVRVDEKQPAGKSGGGSPAYSWWDIQDENAKLPVKEATSSELERLFSPGTASSSSSSSSSDSDATSTAKGAARALGKAFGKVAAGIDTSSSIEEDRGPRVAVIAFKLLDMVKMEDEFAQHHGGGGRGGAMARPSVAAFRDAALREAAATVQASAIPTTKQTTVRPPQAGAQTVKVPHVAPPPGTQRAGPNTVKPPTTTTQPKTVRTPPSSAGPRVKPPKQPSGDLLAFGPTTTNGGVTSGAVRPTSVATGKKETRAEWLKRQNETNKTKQNLVWDPVDQRYVSKDTVSGEKKSAVGASVAPKTNIKATKIDRSAAIGKSATVQAAVHERVKDMEDAQKAAVKEVRDREAAKEKASLEEDEVKRKLEPKIKAWSEEHGQKKRLPALLSSLHTILWPEANWKPVSLGDLLEPSKCKKCFHKASRVVHPDKTQKLDAEKRFLAKRIFDALSQAKTEFESS